MKNKSNILIIFFIVAFLFTIRINNVFADEEETINATNMPCLLCDIDEKEYPKEAQFIERVKILSTVFGDRIDPVALTATVLHKENAADALGTRYEENFDESKFKSNAQSFFSKGTSNQITGISAKQSDVADTEQVDLLIAASIVMADSSGWMGSYNEDQYKKALSGTKLVGNNSDSLVSEFYNAAICGIGTGVNIISIPIDTFNAFLSGGDVASTAKNANKRLYNLTNICRYGYVGGVYEAFKLPQEQQEPYKEHIAQEIIDLIHYYKKLAGDKGDSDEVCEVTTSSGDYASWKQGNSEWKDVSVGGGTLGSIGCLVTSMSIQIARSGTKIMNLPSGYSSFNPGAFAKSLGKNGAFTGGGGFKWKGYNEIAPNWRLGSRPEIVTSNTKTLAQKLYNELSTKQDGKYQKFIILQIHHDGGQEHWVAVDSVTQDSFTVMDPGRSKGNKLDDIYSSWKSASYQVMFATDVTDLNTTNTSDSSSPNTTDTSISNCTTSDVPAEGLTTDLGTGKVHNIPDPVPLYGGGTSSQSGITFDDMETEHYADTTWVYDCKTVREAWKKAGSKSSGYIATLDGRYLVAISEDLADTGDAVDIVLANGQVIRAIIADTKGPKRVSMYGHLQTGGVSLVEFEGVPGYLKHVVSAHSSWKGQKVKQIINYGRYKKIDN